MSTPAYPPLPPGVTPRQTRHLSRLIRRLGIALEEVYEAEEFIIAYLNAHPGLRAVLATHNTGDGCCNGVCAPCSDETVNQFIAYYLGEELPDTDNEAQAARILVRYLEIAGARAVRSRRHTQRMVEDLLRPDEPDDGEATQ